MNHGQLQYYLHDDFDALRFELAGNLSGTGVESIYQAWRTALSMITNRKVIVDITFVDKADEQGRSLLRFWRRKGADIVARSPESRALAADVIGEAIPAIPAASSKKSWLARVVAFASIPADANKRARRDDDDKRKNSDLKAFSTSRLVEPHVP